MTPEETKAYIDHRFEESGVELKLDRAAYEKIYRFTNGTEAGANKVCFKLLSLCSDGDAARTVSADILTTAIDELARVEELMKRSTKPAARKHSEEFDRISIEQLAAVLEANPETADPMVDGPGRDTAVATAPARARPAVNGEPRPKVLVVNDSQTRCAMLVSVLAKNFNCIETGDAERAWKVLTERRDIDMVIADLQGHNRNGHDLIIRMRSTGRPAHLTGIPIIAVAATDDMHAKQRALAAGADEVIPLNTGAGEFEARVFARYRAARAEPRPAGAPRTTKARPAERRVVPSAPPRSTRDPRPPTPVLTRPGMNVKRPVEPSFTDTAHRPFRPAPDAASAAAIPAFIRRLRQISSTTTITLSATILVVVALTIILYANRMNDATTVPTLPALVQRDTATVPPPTPMPTPEASDAQSPRADQPAPPAVPPANPPANATETKPNDGSPAAMARNDTPARSTHNARPAGRDTPADGAGAPLSTPPPPEQAAANRASPLEPPAPARTAPQIVPSPPAAEMDGASAPPQSAVAAPAPRSSPDRLTEDDLAGLLKRFVFVYEAGDIEQFMNLFASNARTNDRTNRSGIREDYENLFRTTDARSMKISYVSWEVENNRAQGWGNFEVTVRRAGEREAHEYQGSITLYVEKSDGRLRIVRLYHGQRRASN